MNQSRIYKQPSETGLSRTVRAASAASAAVILTAAQAASGQTISPEFINSYALTNLGSVAGVPASYGGLTIDPTNPGVLLLGGSANSGDGGIYSVQLLRDALGHIIGFGTVSLRSTAPNIDGGLFVGPGGLLVYAGYPINTIGQILPGSSVPDRVTTMTPLGVPASLGAVAIVPAGFPGAGRWKTTTYNGGAWCDLIVEGPDVSGLFTFTGATIIVGSTLAGPEGIAYVPLFSALFPRPSVLVTEYNAGQVATFEINASGDPIWETRRLIVTGLGGAEGAAIDPVTGDFLFSTFGSGNQVVRVSGFNAARCLADLVGGDGNPPADGSVDGNDFSAFLNAFGAGSSLGDIVGGDGNPPSDGSVDGNDFAAFLNAFGAGC